MSIRKRRVVPNRLRVWRAERRLTQMVLARRAGLPQSRVSMIENEHLEATASEQRRLSRALKAAVHEVFPPMTEPEALAS